MGMGLLKGCSQAAAAASAVRSPVPVEETSVQFYCRLFPLSYGFSVENFNRSTAQIGGCLGSKGRELQTPLCSFS